MSTLVGGLLSPLLTPAHALALLALGFLIGQQRGGPVPLAAFVAGLAAGLVAIARAVGETAAPDILLATTAMSAGLVALARPLPRIVPAALAAVVGVTLGLDSPPEVISVAAATVMLMGTWVGAGLAVGLIAAGAQHLTRWWQRLGLRIVGSWIVASAVLVLALRYARGLMF
jgi:urease accessory protein